MERGEGDRETTRLTAYKAFMASPDTTTCPTLDSFRHQVHCRKASPTIKFSLSRQVWLSH